MMNTQTENYDFELFLEGVKVPFSAANVSQSTSGVAASIALPLDYNIRKILPNTLVHLFFKRHGDDWRLLFDGYVTGVSENISSNTSSISLQCRDISNYLDLMWKFYSNNQNYGELQPKILRHFGAPDDPKSLYARLISETARQQNVSNSRSVMNLLINLVTDVLQWKEGDRVVSNTFLQTIHDQVKFLQRFFYEDDERVSFILDKEVWESIFSREGFDGLQTTRSIINVFLSKIYYIATYIASPILSNGKLNQIIFKPDNFIIPAPLCNVILPDMISSFEYSRNFQAEPTRLMLRSDPFWNKDKEVNELWQYMAYAPYEMKQLEKNNILHYGLINDETYRGIIPTVTETETSIRLLGSHIDENRKESDKYFASMKYAAEYLLQKKQTENRVFNSGECTFNPNMVVGYPGVVIKDPLIIMGNIVSINHSISSQGRINTTFSMVNCRTSNLRLSESENKLLSNRYSKVSFNWSSNSISSSQREKAILIEEDPYPYPIWLNEKYYPAQIDNVYLKSLGCKSIMSTLANPNSSSKIENARAIYTNYESYKSRGAGLIYVNNISNRQIVTKKQFFEQFISSIEKVNEEEYKDSASMPAGRSFFKADHQRIIKNYKASISRGVVIL